MAYACYSSTKEAMQENYDFEASENLPQKTYKTKQKKKSQ
jgi:hypothetical protein